MKQFSLLIAAGLIASFCFGQADSTDKTSANDSTTTKATLALGVTYSNNANYYGQRAEESLPYIAAGGTYRMRSGIYFSALAYRLLHGNSGTVSAANLGAGIDFKMGKKITMDISYNHTFYPTYSPFLQASDPDNATALLTWENWLSSTLNVDYAFGKTKDVFVTIGTGKSVTLYTGKKSVISITPTIDIVGGTQHFYQTYLVEKRLQDSILGVLLPPLIGGQPPGTTAKTTSSTEFNLISYNFKLPLVYNRSNYLLEASYQFSVLSNEAQSGPGKANSFLSFSFYYQF